MRLGGMILCGGRSTRMGRPKAWLPFGDELLLQRVVRLLTEAVGPVVVVAAPGQDLPPLPADVAVVRDDVEGRGPLQGLLAGLTALDGRADAAFVTGCDVPFLRPAFVRRMGELLGEASACVVEADGQVHPLGAAYRVAVRQQVAELLAGGRFALKAVLDAVPTRVVSADEVGVGLESLANVNTPEEYEAMLRNGVL